MDNASRIGMSIIDLIVDEEVADVGIGISEALSVFISMCELHHAGGAQQAKALLISSIENLTQDDALSVVKMRKEGLSDEQIRDKILRFIPENVPN